MQAMVLCVAASSLADTSVPVPVPSALSMEIKLRERTSCQQCFQLTLSYVHQPSRECHHQQHGKATREHGLLTAADPLRTSLDCLTPNLHKESRPPSMDQARWCFAGQHRKTLQRATAVCVMRPLGVQAMPR